MDAQSGESEEERWWMKKYR